MGRIGFHAALVDAEGHTAPAKAIDIYISRARYKLKEPQPSFKNRCRAGEAAARQHSGEDPIASGFRVS